jgi:hypothetical protein
MAFVNLRTPPVPPIPGSPPGPAPDPEPQPGSAPDVVPGINPDPDPGPAPDIFPPNPEPVPVQDSPEFAVSLHELYTS